MADRPTFVIVGASLTGALAAGSLRDEGFTGRLILIGEESELPYERPPLSKGYLSGVEAREKARIHDAQWYDTHDIELRLGARATALEPAVHRVTLSDGSAVAYDKLLLATGSRPRRLSAPGGDLTGVHYLRTLTDADRLREGLRTARRVVVIGAGWIGLETAAAARRYGAEVSVVEVDGLPLRRVLGDEVASVYADLHRAHGVQFRYGTWAKELLGHEGRVTAVALADGSELPADLVVVGVGIEPAVELATAAGLVVDNGVVTDATLRTSDPDVYAAGDVANSEHPLLGRRIRVEHWANARYGGKAVARSMLGQAVGYDRVPYFYSDQYDSSPSMGMEYAGWVGPGDYDRVVFRGDARIGSGDPAFLAFWLKDGRVLAGMNVNIWDVQSEIQELVRAGYGGTAVDAAKLADPSVPLVSLLS